MFRHLRAQSNRRHHRKMCGTESLETRCMLDGAAVQTVLDQWEVHENSRDNPLDVLANDTIPADYAGPGVITSVSYGQEGGNLRISDDGKSVFYAAGADFVGTDRFTYYIDDLFAGEAEVEVTSPLQPDRFEFPADGRSRRLDVLANDPFWEGYDGERQITSVSVTTKGNTVNIATDGKSLRYRAPVEGVPLGESFVYVVDSQFSVAVDVVVRKAVVDDHYDLLMNNNEATFEVLDGDPFYAAYAGERRITLITQPKTGHASITEDGQAIRFTPGQDATGSVTVGYLVDGIYGAKAVFHLHQPTRDDYTNLDRNSKDFPINVLNNDRYLVHSNSRWHESNPYPRGFDFIDQVTSVDSISLAGGSIRIADNGEYVLYTPPEGFVGDDEFTYVANGKYPATV
ncbi:MAG: hypothetical protein KDA60_14655, partial [Planctomycetales bacterium]|nr:hypothetical protein [Planctomycetales bacterium]